MSRNSNKLLISESGQALDQWKYEIAAELGLAITIPNGHNQLSSNHEGVEFASELGVLTPESAQQSEPYWGHVSSREAGAVGGEITRRLIRLAQLTKLDD